MKYSFNDPIACLLAVINDMDKRISEVGLKMKVDDVSGFKNDVKRLKLSVQRFLRLKDDNEKAKTVGFFGAQKRGKSSLINVLLGCKLMPTGAIPMSSTTIRVKQDKSLPDDKYTVDIIFNNGHHQQHNNQNSVKAGKLLEKYGSRKGGDFAESVSEIVVIGNFKHSKIMANGGMLVDTPGAELAFGEVVTEGENEGEYKSEIDNEKEVANALKTLENTQIIVFTERIDYMESKNSVKFYRDELEKLKPVTVLNFMDKWLDNHDEEPFENAIEQMKDAMFKVFEYEDVICVSSKDKVFEAKENGNNKLLEENGINKLEEVILERLNNFSTDKIVTESVKEIEDLLARLNKKINGFKINKLFLKNFFNALKNVDLGLYCERKFQLEALLEDKRFIRCKKEK